MANDLLLGTLPHELEVADAELREALAREQAIGVPGSIIRNFQRPKAVQEKATRYVDEVFRVEGGRAELLRCAMVLPTMTADGTEFAEAWADLKKSAVRWRDRLEPYYPGESMKRCRRQIPVNVSCIANFAGRPETVEVLEQFMRSVEIPLACIAHRVSTQRPFRAY